MRKIVFTSGVFDILHEGHIRCLMEARKLAKNGLLIVGVLTDEAVMECKPRPTLSFPERLLIVSSLWYVDAVVPQSDYIGLQAYCDLRPDIVAIGQNWSKANIERAEHTCKEIDCKLVTVPYFDGQSSTKIKEKIRGTSSDPVL